MPWPAVTVRTVHERRWHWVSRHDTVASRGTLNHNYVIGLEQPVCSRWVINAPLGPRKGLAKLESQK